jgi:hypothetical protein
MVSPKWTTEVLQSVTGKEGLGAALAAVFASGALGYIFATIYHFLHWNCRFCNQGVLDHSKMVNKLLETRDVLDQPKGTTVKRRRADELVVTLWSQRNKAGGTVGPEADKKLNSLTDLTHGLGAFCVASLFALIVAIVLCCNLEAIKLE